MGLSLTCRLVSGRLMDRVICLLPKISSIMKEDEALWWVVFLGWEDGVGLCSLLSGFSVVVSESLEYLCVVVCLTIILYDLSRDNQ